ncbi:MAG: BamA/TamA family outer membrane protein, partial [Pirellulaceae bacterium]
MNRSGQTHIQSTLWIAGLLGWSSLIGCVGGPGAHPGQFTERSVPQSRPSASLAATEQASPRALSAPRQTSIYTTAEENSPQHVVAAKPNDEATGSEQGNRASARGQSPGNQSSYAQRPQPTPGSNDAYRGAMPISGAPLQPAQGQVAPVQYQQPVQNQQQLPPYQAPQNQAPTQQYSQTPDRQSGSQVYGNQGYQGPQTYLGNGYAPASGQPARQPGTQALGQSPYNGQPGGDYGQPPLPPAPNTGTGVIPVSRPLGGAPIYNPPLGPDAIITPNPYEDPGRRYADVMVNAMEGQTGRLQLGVGVNSDAGVTGSIVIDERNFDWRRVPTSFDDVWNGRAFRGAGQGFRIEAMPGNIVQRYMVTYTDPYLFDTPLSLNLSGYLFDRIYRDWREQRIGGRGAIGYRLTPDLSTSVGLRAESVKIHDPRVVGVPELDDALGKHGLYAANWQISHDTRDLPFAPTEGHLFEINLEQAFGAYDYSRAEVDYRKYFLLAERPDGSGRHTLGFSGRVGFTGSDTPIFENYFAGGFSTLRGFEFRRFGPKSGDVFTGGQFRMLGSAEYTFPITADDMVKGVLFTDIGAVERTARFEADNFGVAPGLGLRISVPALGQAPIALDFAFPINRRDSDEVQVFS